ncbi:MAG: hypothetical protein J5858_00085, partial [Lentisphaeria bacterium]|nr:hypothetical protein [Lentisphaeria bacterium]
RLLKPGGLFITQQVGSDNDRELVEMVLPGAEKPFPDENLKAQKASFVDAGFEILQSDEAFGPICFYDVGAFVWFARIIEWEFPGFSVDRCFDRLLQLQETVERDGKICGTTHRYLIVARKPLKETDNSPGERLKEENSMEHKKKGNNWTAYYDSETDRYFAEIMYTSREGREQYDYEITKDIYSRLGTFGDDTDNERLIKTADMTYSFENTMYGTLGPERTVWDEEALKTMEKAVQNQEKKEKEKKKKRS